MTTNAKTPQQVLKSAQERRYTGDRRRVTFDYPSDFVTQVLTNFEGTEPLGHKPARNTAVEAYVKGSTIGVRRAPSGIAHEKSV